MVCTGSNCHRAGAGQRIAGACNDVPLRACATGMHLIGHLHLRRLMRLFRRQRLLLLPAATTYGSAAAATHGDVYEDADHHADTHDHADADTNADYDADTDAHANRYTVLPDSQSNRDADSNQYADTDVHTLHRVLSVRHDELPRPRCIRPGRHHEWPV